MNPHEIDALVQRLLANPHDREALQYAHREGARDPRSYALVLEKVGSLSTDPAYASYWLTEAANVWATSLGDAHRTARLLMMALEQDPTYDLAAERLAQLYRDKGENKALVALLERRVKTLEPMTAHSEETRALVAGMHEELGRLWSEPPLAQTKKAIERYQRAIELDPRAGAAIYALRELFKKEEQFVDALPLFEAEQALVTDEARKIALYRDEAAVRELADDLPGATEALRRARRLDVNDPALAQEFGATILERVLRGQSVSEAERDEGAKVFVLLAESYENEHGLAYANAALDIEAGHDRAMQLAAHWAEAIGQSSEILPRWRAYLAANPRGPLAEEARKHVGDVPALSEEVDEAEILDEELEALLEPLEEIEPEPELEPMLEAEAELEPSEDLLVQSGDVPGLLQAASHAVSQGDRDEAYRLYSDILALDAAQPEALSWVEDHHRQQRQYAELRDVLVRAARSSSLSHEIKKQQYREIAGLCETHLRDLEGAILAYRQICQLDRADELARHQLKRLLERASRWDELAALLEQEAMGAPDIETRILLERRLAQLHESKRGDDVGAGEAWARIAGLVPDDDSAISTAADFFVKGGRPELAIEVISENISAIEEDAIRAELLERLGRLSEAQGENQAAGDAFASAARITSNIALWARAEASFSAAESFIDAADAAIEQAKLSGGDGEAAFHARAGEHFARAGEEAKAAASYERALDLEPENEAHAREVESRYEAAGLTDKLVESLLGRAARVETATTRLALRKRAAHLQASALDDRDAARTSLALCLEDGEDREALRLLAEYAEASGDFEEAVTTLRRLESSTEDREERLEIVLEQAALLEEHLGDAHAAIARYEEVLTDLDPKNRPALEKIARLYEQQGDSATLALTLERTLTLAEDDEERLALARRLATLYEGALQDTKRAIEALEIVHRLESEDFDAVARLHALAEKAGDDRRAARYLGVLIEVEGDSAEISKMSRRLAEILARLEDEEGALRALSGPADAGDAACREAFVELGDRFGRSDEVAAKLLGWYLAAAPSEARNQALQGAFERFVAMGNDAEAVEVALQLLRSKPTEDIAKQLEIIAVRAKNLDALNAAHDALMHPLSGEARALEYVRQAEALVRAGVDTASALLHGEQGLPSMPPGEAGPLLERLAALATESAQVVDLYERQVGRCKAPADRLRALAEAARVAASSAELERARGFFGLALSGQVPEDAIDSLEEAARSGDAEAGNDALRRMLAEALAEGGHGLRDGGRTRSALLRRAAILAERELSDVERAFEWLGGALVAHVDDETLDTIESLAEKIGEPQRIEAALGRALGEVFDGPLVRKLLGRRIALRRDILDNLPGAAEDLKRLHDLAPSDTAIAEELSALLTELGDHRGMVQLLEDQILRGRDPHARAELARRVAGIWEKELDEPREAADAWRRVLRMKPGDAEAQEGLERARAEMQTRAGAEGEATPPRRPSRSSVAPPPRRSVPPQRGSVRPPPRSSVAPPAPAPVPPPIPAAAIEEAALLIEDLEPIEAAPEASSLPSMPPPLPSAPPPLPSMPPPLPPSGLTHSGPPPLPPREETVGDDEVLLVDDAELIEED